MIKTKKQHFCCVETKDIGLGHVNAKVYYEALRENETEYIISNEKEKVEFRATREELLSCGYLC